MYDYKLRWNNQSIDFYTRLYEILPANEAVFDLTGETIFARDGYYFCCVPYGHYEGVLRFPYPKLEETLRQRQVKFIHVHGVGRLTEIPFMQARIIRQYYLLEPFKSYSRFMISGVFF